MSQLLANIRSRNKVLLTCIRNKSGEGPELKGTYRGDPDITVRYRASGIFWVPIETRVNLGVGTDQGHFHTVSTKTFFSPDTQRCTFVQGKT